MSPVELLSPESQNLLARWNASGPPLRPSSEDIELMTRCLSGGEGARVLVQGATPELVDLALRKRASRVIAMDWDAAHFIQPFGVKAVKEGFAEYLLDYSALPLKIQFTMFFFSEDLLKSDRQKGVDFLTATFKGVREYLRAAKGKGDRARVLDIASRFTQMPKDLLETFTWPYVDPNGTISLESLGMQQDWYLERKYVKEKIDIRKVTDLTLLENALKRIGQVDVQTLVSK